MKSEQLRIIECFKNNFKMMSLIYHIDKKYTFFTLIYRLVCGIRTAFLYVYLLGYVIYCVENNISLSVILLLLGGSLFALAVAFGVEVYYQNIFRPIHKEKIVSHFQNDVFDRLQHADIMNYDSEELYTTIKLADEEITVRPLAVVDNCYQGIECLVAFLTIMLGAMGANWFVLGICLISFIVGIVLTNIRSKKVVRYDREMKIKDKKVSLLRRLLYLPEYAKENRLSKVHNTFLNDFEETIIEKEELAANGGKQIGRLAFLQNLFCSAICIDFLIPFYLCIAILYYGKFSIAEFIVAVNASYQIQMKLDDMTTIFSGFLENGRLVERLSNVNKIRRDIETTKGKNVDDNFRELVLQNVSFHYPDGTIGLSDINLTIKKGSKIAIVGRNGSGKTTLVKMLMRLYDPSTGTILINGEGIKNYNITSYRKQFGTVFQDFKIYAVSVKDNICMGNELCLEKIHCAMETVGLSEQIQDLELQMTKEFDEKGIMYSGGILQRLALARVCYEDKEIIILDEPTAAMDIFFEKKFYNLLFEIFKDKTVILISHRLSSVTACNEIIYMENGKICEKGSHEELMKLRGRYYQLFKAHYD